MEEIGFALVSALVPRHREVGWASLNCRDTTIVDIMARTKLIISHDPGVVLVLAAHRWYEVPTQLEVNGHAYAKSRPPTQRSISEQSVSKP